MEPSQLGWEPLVISWMNTLPDTLQSEENSSLIRELFHWLIPPAFKMLRRHCRVRDPSSTTNPLKKQKNRHSFYFCHSGSLFLGGCSYKQQQQCGVVVPIICNAAFWAVKYKSCWWEHSHLDQGRRTMALISINDALSIYFQQKILIFPLSWSFDCTLHRRRFPSPWCGPRGAAVTQRAEKSSANFSGRLSQENPRSILSLQAWGHGIAPWTKKAWCMTITIR